jgi:tetratricopeptide (TPR) repeat protein
MQKDSDAHESNANNIEELIGREINGLSSGDALAHIGALIDAAHDEQSRPGTDRAFALLDSLSEDALSPHEVALSHYFRANAWDNRRQEKSDHDVWAWEQPENGEQILELRRAIRHKGFEQLPSTRQGQILTNLANQLDSIGRFVEAIALWDRVLLIHEHFGMALGNRGISLNHYGLSLYDSRHTAVMLVSAFDSLTAATSAEAIFESVGLELARSNFVNLRGELAQALDIEAVRARVDLDAHSLGDSPEERSYRAWCLRERLFINPLNDLGAVPIAAHDVLTLPTITVSGVSARMPPIIGFPDYAPFSASLRSR